MMSAMPAPPFGNEDEIATVVRRSLARVRSRALASHARIRDCPVDAYDVDEDVPTDQRHFID